MTAITREQSSTDHTRAERKAQTRRKLLDTALALVGERGFAALSLRELTREAGITPAAFYRHFANLDQLGLVLVDEAFGALGSMLRDARSERTPPEHLIDASVDVLVRHVNEQRDHFRFLSRELAGGDGTLRTAIRKELQLFRSELAVDLARLPYVHDWATDDLYVLADLIVKTMVSTVQDLLDVSPDKPAEQLAVAERARKQLLLVVLGVPPLEARAVTYPRGDDYQARFDALAASGQDVHGEVEFVLGLEPPPATALDAGCGTGRVAIELARRGIEVVGTDVAADMLDTARRLAPDLLWVEADLSTIELDRPFDVVVMAGNVLLFVEPGTQPAVLERCAAHVAPGGAVVTGFSIGQAYDLDRLDADAGAAGLHLAERYATWDRQPWQPGGEYAVSVLRAPPA